MRVSYEQMRAEFIRVLNKKGVTGQRAELCATLVAQTSLDGVYTHGLNRFPRMIDNIERGVIDVNARPELVESFGCIERWDGHRGVGNLNAHACMERTIALAKEHMFGCVALRNNNHWMRPGAYGLMAADAGCIGVLWTNTVPNMPPWGGAEPRMGNDPLVICFPHEGGHLLLDVAMSLFSYGKIEKTALEGGMLPYDGGFDKQGNLTRDPNAIIESKLPMPIGYWKGSGLAFMLDMIAAALSGGSSSREIGLLDDESNISQMFLAVDISRLPDRDRVEQMVRQSMEDVDNCPPMPGWSKPRCPGEGMLRVRAENLEKGIPVNDGLWNAVRAM